jgi:sugar/nucleoside kinase (ribokinase family)
MTVLIIGDANADVSATLRQFPFEGDDGSISALAWNSGGSAANVAAALAHLGTATRLLARVGRDPAADIALRVAHTSGVDLTFIQRDSTVATGLCFVAISPNSERTFFSFRGANVTLEMPDTDALLEDVRWLHIAGHALLEGRQRGSTAQLMTEATRRAIPISLDLCLPLLRAWRAEIVQSLPTLRILFANTLEIDALLPDVSTLSTLDPAYSEYGLNEDAILALKHGAQGCIIMYQGRQYELPAYQVVARDTNGCGDAFVAGFLHTYLRGDSIEACATFANAIGALTATRIGAVEALPDQQEVEAFLRSAEG